MRELRIPPSSMLLCLALLGLAACDKTHKVARDTGTRHNAAMVYRGDTGEYVLVGGAVTYALSGIGKEIQRERYDVQSLVLTDLRCKNQFPPGKNWGPQVGPTTRGKPRADRQVAVYDLERDRLLLFASHWQKGQAWAYGLKDNTLTALDPRGAADVVAKGADFMREAVYIPTHDLVFFGSAYDDGGGEARNLVYDAAQNRWLAYAVDPDNIRPHGIYDVSLGLVVDDKARLWAINSRSHIFVLKLDPASADKLQLQ